MYEPLLKQAKVQRERFFQSKVIVSYNPNSVFTLLSIFYGAYYEVIAYGRVKKYELNIVNLSNWSEHQFITLNKVDTYKKTS